MTNSGKYLSFKKNLGLFVRKNFIPRPHLALITAASQQSAQQRTAMVGESWDVFIKRMLVEKHISGISE